MPTGVWRPIVFRAEVQEFRRAKDRLSGVLWIEMLGTRKLDLGHGEVFVSNEVQMWRGRGSAGIRRPVVLDVSERRGRRDFRKEERRMAKNGKDGEGGHRPRRVLRRSKTGRAELRLVETPKLE